jgi:L-ascorbate metabolism protein UlaG (beta-lactamase superfamily)
MIPFRPSLQLFGLGALILAAHPAAAEAALTARWLGVAGLSITDGTTTLLFDPVFTKPDLRHWLLNSVFQSDPSRVEKGLAAAGVSRADAAFASHCHFDHASDIGLVSAKTGAVVRGGPSLRKIALSNPAVRARFEELRDETAFSVGRFRIIPYRREHPPILRMMDWKFLPGPVPDDFRYAFYDYREGEVWGFRVEHPEGNLLIDQSSQWRPKNAAYAGDTDTYFVGVANSPGLEQLLEGNIRKIAARRVIPLHFDLFFLQSDALEARILPGMRLDELASQLNQGTERSFIVPSRYEPIPVGRPAP